MVQKACDFSQRRDPSSSQRTSRVEDGRNGKTWYSKLCEPKFLTETNAYRLSDNQLRRDLDLEPRFSLGVAGKREIVLKCGARGGTVGWGTALPTGRSQESLELFIDISFRPGCGPGTDSDCNRNEYQEYFLVCEGHRCVGLATPSYADFLEIWEPQPPGTLRACPGL
jgi:hypothetical protein